MVITTPNNLVHRTASSESPFLRPTATKFFCIAEFILPLLTACDQGSLDFSLTNCEIFL